MLSPPPGTAWNGQASQDELMHKDCCALVDERDNIVGHATKWDVHRFEGATPRGQLHRAFSAFLFDGDGRLLLQRRAASKITFPGVWTNTCCSHPLAGFTPSELDAHHAYGFVLYHVMDDAPLEDIFRIATHDIVAASTA